jgi:methyl-accepting chemotaxis protein
MEEIDLSREEKVEILKETVSKFLPNKNFIYDDPNFLIVDSDKRIGFSKTGFRVSYNKGLFNRKVERFGSPTVIKNLLSGNGESYYFKGVSETNFQGDDFKVLEKLYKIYVEYFNKIEEIKQSILDKKREQERLKEEQRLKKLEISQTNILSELDKDGNGEVDVIEGNDFNTLLKKHQKSIVEVDRNYVQQFVKVSSYLKTKKGNIQSIFNSIKDTPNQEVLNEYVEILKDEIHTYNLVLFNSLNMIVSLVEDDMITFYEIHEMFDTLNMFDSKHEKDVSQKLTNIGDGLKDLMYEVRRMGNKISSSIQELSYVTEESNRQLTNQLSEIDSTMKVGNLINTINTYQNYKNNRRLNR